MNTTELKLEHLIAAGILLLILTRVLFFSSLPEEVFFWLLALFFVFISLLWIGNVYSYFLAYESLLQYALIISFFIVSCFLLPVILTFLFGFSIFFWFSVLATCIMVSLIAIVCSPYGKFTKLMAYLMQNIIISRIVIFLENPKRLAFITIPTVIFIFLDILFNSKLTTLTTINNIKAPFLIYALVILQPVFALILYKIKRAYIHSSKMSKKTTKWGLFLGLTYGITLFFIGLLVLTSLLIDFIILCDLIKSTFYFK